MLLIFKINGPSEFVWKKKKFEITGFYIFSFHCARISMEPLLHMVEALLLIDYWIRFKLM